MNTFEKLSEVSPFWAGAITACADQGFDAQGTRELLKKCAQADPILEEEYAALIKYAEGEGIKIGTPAAPLQPVPSSLPPNYAPNPHSPMTVPNKTWGQAFSGELSSTLGNVLGVIPDSLKTIGGAGGALIQGDVDGALDVAKSLDYNTMERFKNFFTPTEAKPNYVNKAINRTPSSQWTAALAGGALDGVGNLANGLGNAVNTVGGAHLTVAAAALEAATKAVNLGGKTPTTEWTEAMRKALYGQTDAALKSFISNIGNAADPSKAVDYKPEVVRKIFDQAGVPADDWKRTAQGFSQDVADEAGSLAALATFPGAAVSGTKNFISGGRSMFRPPLLQGGPRLGATAFERLQYPFNRGATAAGDYGRGMFRGTDMLKPITPGTPTWKLLNNPNLNFGARQSVIPAGPTAASIPQSLAKTTGLNTAGRALTPLIKRIPGGSKIVDAVKTTAGKTNSGLGALAEAELFDYGITRGTDNALNLAYPTRENPSRTGQTSVWQAVMAQPESERLEHLTDYGKLLTVKKPSDVWGNGMQQDGADPVAVFREAFGAYQNNTFRDFAPQRALSQPSGQLMSLPLASMAGSRVANRITNAIDTPRPRISLSDPHAAADFKIVIEGYAENEAANYFEQHNKEFNTWAKATTIQNAITQQPIVPTDVLASQFKAIKRTEIRNGIFETFTDSDTFNDAYLAPEQLQALRGAYRAGVLPPYTPPTGPVLRVPGASGQ